MIKTGQQPARERIQGGAPFALMTLHRDSLERKAAQNGAFAFLAEKHRLGTSFELRDYPRPTSSDLTPELLSRLGIALDKVLFMCDGFPVGSDERYILRHFAIVLPQLFFAFGTRPAHVSRAADLFDQGKWEKLWERVLKEGAKTRARTANNPRKAVLQPSAQRDRYSQRCARKGNLSKAATVLYKASVPACNEDTVERLRDLHPPGPLDFNKDFYPSTQQSAEFWESEDGRNIIEQAFSISNVRTHFRTRPALGAPDPDGWRGREHISWLFMNDDEDAQQRIITHLMLPYATGDFHPDYLHEHAGGRLSAFLKPDGVRVRPINNASVWRRGTATLICQYVRKDASDYLTGSCPNFIQTAGSRDGASICAKLVSLIHDLPQEPDDPRVICQIDFENAFQMPPRQLCVGDCILGKASRTYDNDAVQVGDALPHLAALKPFFEYFRSMGDVASRNRYTDHHGTTHHIEGTRGGIQGDPLEMVRFCCTVQPIWARILERHRAINGAAYADDAYLMGKLKEALFALADAISSFSNDADLQIQLTKCKIYMPGVPEDRARQLIRDCIESDASGALQHLLPMLDPRHDVIQVHGLRVVGAPIGDDNFVHAFVRDKCETICKDVEQMRLMSDPLIHYHLLKFCMNTRLDFLGRNVIPANMHTANDDLRHIGPRHVDVKITDEVLRMATSNTHMDYTADVREWCKFIVQTPHHLGGYAITPNAASGFAAFYSATANFVRMLAGFTHKHEWLREEQDLQEPDSWSNSQLQALVQAHTSLMTDYKCSEWQAPDGGNNAQDALAPAPQASSLLIPPLQKLALMPIGAPVENADNAQEDEASPQMPSQRRLTKAIMREWGPHHQARTDGAPHPRGQHVHPRHQTQVITCLSRTVEGQPGHSLLQNAMPDDEEQDCEPSKRKKITWTSNAWLNSIGHPMGFSLTHGFNKVQVERDWVSYHCQYLGLDVPHLREHVNDACPCGRFVIDRFGDHLHCCQQHAGATHNAHEHLLSAVQKCFQQGGYATERKQVPHSRGLKKADLWVKDFQLAGVRHVIIDTSVRHEFHGNVMAHANLGRNGEPSHQAVDGALDAAVKEKIDSYADDYNERNFFFLPAVMTTSGRISGDFLRLLYILSHRQAEKFFARLGILDPSPEAFKQRRGNYFYHNRSAIGLACAQATAMRIDIARHKRPIPPARRALAPHLLLHLPMLAQHV